MGELIGHHERSCIGKTVSQAFTDTAAEVDLISNAPSGLDFPYIIEIRPDQDCHVRQGKQGNVTADTGDKKILQDENYTITVENPNMAAISVIRTSTNGTLEITYKNQDTPGDD